MDDCRGQGSVPPPTPGPPGRWRSGRWCAPRWPSGSGSLRALGHGQGQDREQAVAHTPPITRVSHILKNLGQGLARQDGHGGI